MTLRVSINYPNKVWETNFLIINSELFIITFYYAQVQGFRINKIKEGEFAPYFVSNGSYSATTNNYQATSLVKTSDGIQHLIVPTSGDGINFFSENTSTIPLKSNPKYYKFIN